MDWCATCIALSAFLWVAPIAGAGGDAENAIDTLIAQLGSKDFKARAAAERELLKREDAAPSLKAALKSTDAEIARRARCILDEFERRQRQRLHERLVSLRKSGEVDQLLERVVQTECADQPQNQHWDVTLDLVRDLIQREKQEHNKLTWLHKAVEPKQWQHPLGNLPAFLKATQPRVIIAAGPQLANDEHRISLTRGREISVSVLIQQSVLVSSGPIRLVVTKHPVAVDRCVLLAGGSIEVLPGKDVVHMLQSVILCDGAFKTNGSVRESLIIAREGVTIEGSATDSVIVSGGKIRIAYKSDLKKCVIKEEEANPLGLVHFFDPARAGLEIDANGKGGVVVKKVAAGKPFAKAGFQPGDELLTLDGTPVGTPETCRRLLRRALAADREATFRVRRDGKPLALKLPPPD